MKKWQIVAILLISVIEIGFSQLSIPVIGLEVGNIAPEIKLPNLKGDTITLSSFRGQMVLIDFWATWCSPCVKEQPKLAALYRKCKGMKSLKRQKFEIYGVSLDSKKEAWSKAIKKIHIGWPQVSDLKFWNSQAAKLYQLEDLPFNLLINDKGIIIAKNLHGLDLEKTVLRYKN